MGQGREPIMKAINNLAVERGNSHHKTRLLMASTMTGRASSSQGPDSNGIFMAQAAF
jgi:hypothetical protein